MACGCRFYTLLVLSRSLFVWRVVVGSTRCWCCRCHCLYGVWLLVLHAADVVDVTVCMACDCRFYTLLVLLTSLFVWRVVVGSTRCWCCRGRCLYGVWL